MRLQALLLAVLTAALGCCASTANAQYVIGKIVSSGSERYPQADLIRLSGLEPGKALSTAGMQAASARLSATGYFQSVEVTVDGPVKSIEVRFKVKPITAEQLIPVGFENLVWLTPEEITAFRLSIPLLALGIPDRVSTLAQIQTALEQLLTIKGVTATITHRLVEPSATNPERAYNFRAESPDPHLGVAHLRGVTADLAPAVRLALTAAQRRPYNEALAGVTTTSIMLAPYFNAGDLDASLTGFSRGVVSPSAVKPSVEVTATVDSGLPYKVSSITFPGTPLLSSTVFQQSSKLHPGDVASRKLLLLTVEPISHAYQDHAYLDEYVETHPVLDPAAHTVSYTVTVTPGEQYRVKSIEMTNLPAELRADANRIFPMHVGDLYIESGIGSFLTNHPEVKRLEGYTASYTASADPETHLVDLVITFHK